MRRATRSDAGDVAFGYSAAARPSPSCSSSIVRMSRPR